MDLERQTYNEKEEKKTEIGKTGNIASNVEKKDRVNLTDNSDYVINMRFV